MEVDQQTLQGLIVSINHLIRVLGHFNALMGGGLGLAIVVCLWFMFRYEKDRHDSGLVFDEFKAKRLYDENKLADLISYCQKAAKKHPNDGEILWYLSLGLYQDKQYNESLDCFYRLLSVDPNYKRACEEYVLSIREQLNKLEGLSMEARH